MVRNPTAPRIYSDYGSDYGSLTIRLHQVTIKLCWSCERATASEH